MTCTNKHTAFQPSNDEWLCPKCGANNDFFIIEWSPNEDSGIECDLLHDDDEVRCRKCDSVWSGKRVAKMFEEKSDYGTCPCCKGTGKVKKEGKVERALRQSLEWVEDMLADCKSPGTKQTLEIQRGVLQNALKPKENKS